MLIAHQPEELTVEAIKAAAKEFALRINNEGFHESTYLVPTSQAIVRAFHRSVVDQFVMTPPHASEDDLPQHRAPPTCTGICSAPCLNISPSPACISSAERPLARFWSAL